MTFCCVSGYWIIKNKHDNKYKSRSHKWGVHDTNILFNYIHNNVLFYD